ASLNRMAFPLPERPSIAVLPFDNLSGDPEQTYLSDGISENVITDLSRFKQLFVIARSSSFAYKDKPVKVRQVAEELGVQYVLEGSVQKLEDRVRITAQLIDAMSGYHIWAERYDKSLKDVLSVQDEITQAIVATVASQILGDAQEKLSKAEVKDFGLWDYVLRARAHHFRFTKDDNEQGKELLQEALKLDPDFAPAHWRLAWAHYLDFFFRWSENSRQSLETAHEHAQRAVDLEPANYQGHWVLGRVSLWKRQYDQAEASFSRALELNPSNADLIMIWANTMVFLGQAEEALPLAHEAMRLNPVKHPAFYSATLALAQFFNGRYDDAIATLQKSGRLSSPSHRLMAASYAQSDRVAEAQPHVKAVLEARPNFSVAKFGKALPFKRQDELELYLTALRKAGLPE
ncbi:MAG: tetratricopeptide repeat protein, partial [Nitrospiraceae bacterium]